MNKPRDDPDRTRKHNTLLQYANRSNYVPEWNEENGKWPSNSIQSTTIFSMKDKLQKRKVKSHKKPFFSFNSSNFYSLKISKTFNKNKYVVDLSMKVSLIQYFF